MIPALFGIGATLGSIYHVGKSVENLRYWNDYYRNTGYRPRYPFRAGRFDSINGFSYPFYGFGSFGLSSDPVPDYGFWSYSYRRDPMYG